MYMYMIADKHTGCTFTIALAIGSKTHHDTIAVYMESYQNSTITLMTAGTNSSKSAAIITHRQQVNNSLDCRIDSLEVYRGRKHTTRISHDGFSINVNESILVQLIIFVMQILNVFLSYV